MDEVGRLEGLKVLIADDSDAMLEMLKYLVEQEGGEATSAENGLVAIDCVKSNKFDVILMDIQMPSCDGLEATKRIREMSVETPIIAVTAASKEEVKNLKDLGFTFVSHKPVEFELLIDIINSVTS